MGDVVALVSQKGGVGKTTLAVSMAGEMVDMGYRVLLVDADPQESADIWHGRGEGEGWPTVIKHTQPTLHKDTQIPQLAEAYDVVLIDVPGKLDKITISALAATDLALVPLGPSALDLEAAAATLDAIEQAQIVNPDLQARYVLSKLQVGTTQARDIAIVLAADPDLNILPVLQTQIHQRTDMAKCPNEGDLITHLYPDSAAHLEIHALTCEVLELLGYELVEIGDEAEEDGEEDEQGDRE